MLITEFEQLSGLKVSSSEYENIIEKVYMETSLEKDEFCKMWKGCTKEAKDQLHYITMMLISERHISEDWKKAHLDECQKHELEKIELGKFLADEAHEYSSMKARDKDRKDSIAVLVSAAKKIAIDAGNRENIPEETVNQAILGELKSVKEQIDTCPADRTDLKEAYQRRYDVFSEFAPKMLSAEEVETVIKEKFSDVIAGGNKGMVMKAVMAELKGKADGKVINETVAKLMK